jgi:hypothetical protein
MSEGLEETLSTDFMIVEGSRNGTFRAEKIVANRRADGRYTLNRHVLSGSRDLAIVSGDEIVITSALADIFGVSKGDVSYIGAVNKISEHEQCHPHRAPKRPDAIHI